MRVRNVEATVAQAVRDTAVESRSIQKLFDGADDASTKAAFAKKRAAAVESFREKDDNFHTENMKGTIGAIPVAGSIIANLATREQRSSANIHSRNSADLGIDAAELEKVADHAQRSAKDAKEAGDQVLRDASSRLSESMQIMREIFSS